MHPLSKAINERIYAIEDDQFLSPAERTLVLESTTLGMLLSLAHERAAQMVLEGDENGETAMQIVANATLAVT